MNMFGNLGYTMIILIVILFGWILLENSNQKKDIVM